jgi:hypothetical protein
MQCFPVKSLVHKVLGGGGVYAYIRYVSVQKGVAVFMRAYGIYYAQPSGYTILDNAFWSNGCAFTWVCFFGIVLTICTTSALEVQMSACMFHGNSVHRKCLINCSLNQKKVPLTHIGLHSSHFWTRGEPYTKLQTKHAKL